VREPAEMGGEPVAEVAVGRLSVAVGDEALEHLGADVTGASASAAPAPAPASGAGGRWWGHVLARRGRALPDALLDGPTFLRRRHHPPTRPRPAPPPPTPRRAAPSRRHLPRIAAPRASLASPRPPATASSLAHSSRVF
jgi:hypothetical protein